MSKPTAAVAEIVETEVTLVDNTERGLVITSMTPGSAIEANFEALEARVAGILVDYTGVTVTADQVGEAKKARAFLNSLSTSINQVRKDVKVAYTRPYTAFEERVKALDAPIKAASLAIDEQVKAFEAAEKVAKRIELVKHYEEFAGALVDVVPFERIEDPAWLNKTTNLMAAFDSIEAAIGRIARDDATLDGMGLAHLTDAKTTYFETLDLGAAIARAKALDEADERTRRLEAEKAAIAAYQAEVAAKPTEPEPRVDSIPLSSDEFAQAMDDAIVSAGAVPMFAPAVATFTFTVTCTDAQRVAITDSIRAMGLTGTVRKEASL